MAYCKYKLIASSRHTSTEAYYRALRPSRGKVFQFMDYDHYTYFAPPRPELAVPPDLIADYEARGYLAQLKKNGTANLITLSPEGNLITTTRHGTPHMLWAPSEASSEIFKALPRNGWYCFGAELLHSKTRDIRDTNFIFDLLVHRSKKLIDRTFAQRQAILFTLLADKIVGETDSYFILNAHTWLAKSFSTGLTSLFYSLTAKEDEGLVLRNPNAKWTTRNAMAKCRRPSKSYAF